MPVSYTHLDVYKRREYEKRVLEDKISSFIAAKELLDIYFKDLK